jgi:hypothetical protein
MLNRIAHLGILCGLLIGTASMAGCTADQEALIVERALAITPGDDGLACTVEDDGETGLSRDVLDASFASGYAAAFTVKNNLNQTTVTGTNSGVEASEMKLTDVIVELTMPSDPDVISGVASMDGALTKFSVPIGSSSFSGQDTYSSFVVVPAESISAIGAQMAASGVTDTTMIMSVVYRALRSSNTGVGQSGVVESRSFELPITVCLGCLRSCVGVGSGGCTQEECDSGQFLGAGGVCGNAQTYSVQPLCCDGDPENDSGLCG